MKSFLESEFSPVPPEEAKFYIIPCPLEKTVSYGKGAGKGPEAILAASQELESQENGMKPGNSGIYTAPPIDCSGPLDLVLLKIEHAVDRALKFHSIPVLLGGEHTISLAAFRALDKYFKKRGEKFGVVQFDAHADLRSEYRGEKLSHATFMHMAIEEMDIPIAQFAVREISPEEIEVREVRGFTHYDAYFLARVGLPEKPLPDDFPVNIYITFDLDALDSSLMPATGTPSPGGLNWRETHYILETLSRNHKIAGFDVVELAPIESLPHADFSAAKLVHLLMGLAISEESHE